MAEFSWFGDALPREEASTREHYKQIAEDIRHEREADRLARTRGAKRPWWRFWARGVH